MVSEIALAMIALIAAGLFIRSMDNAQHMSIGFESLKLFTMNVDLGSLHYTEGRGQQFFREAVAAIGFTLCLTTWSGLLGGDFPAFDSIRKHC